MIKRLLVGLPFVLALQVGSEEIDLPGLEEVVVEVQSTTPGLPPYLQEVVAEVRTVAPRPLYLQEVVVEFIKPGFIPVVIDIKPGGEPNCFNLNGQGVIPVAILGSAEFDITLVDPGTVVLEGLAIKAVGKSNKLLAHIEDVNLDGFDDLVVQIQDSDALFELGDATATLTGNLFDGTPIQGTDSICIVP